MLSKKTHRYRLTLPWAEELDHEFAEAATLNAPAISGCEVTEYDDVAGLKAWNDSVFVQDFTDSVLATHPAPLDFDDR